MRLATDIPDAPDATSLVLEVAGGDVGAMERLLDRYRAELLAYARRHVPSDLRRVIDPQDVLQDTFFEAFRRLRQFDAREPDSARRWLLTITRHRIINLVKARRAAKRGGTSNLLEFAAASTGAGDEELLGPLLHDLAVYERTPSQSAVAHELAAALESAVARLPPHYRLAVRLRYVEREGVAAVASALGRTEGATQMVLNRALKLLRAELVSASRYT